MNVLVAIMGPSGAGKTSLLDVLAGRNKLGDVTGSIAINGHFMQIGSSTQQIIPKVSGYIMQESVFINTLTVTEVLQYAFRLRKGGTLQQEQSVIEDILQVLNLSSISDRVVGDPLKRGISGGERCRLAIGVELVVSPSLLFLDEPTSGLDTTHALRVMSAIGRLCSLGHTIVATIHQPRSTIFNLFDYLLLLHEGKTVYYGEANKAVHYFKERGILCPSFINPADFLLDMLEHEGGEEEDSEEEDDPDKEQFRTVIRNELSVLPQDLHTEFLKSEEHKKLNRAQKQTKFELDDLLFRKDTVSDWSKFLLLVVRTWKATSRDSGVMYIRTIAALLIGFLVGTLFFQLPDDSSSVDSRTNTLLFLMCVFSLFCLPAINQLLKDRVLFVRERASGFYGPGVYFLSNIVVELPILFMIVLGYGSISYWMVGLNSILSRFGYFIILIFAVIQVGFAVSQLIASAVSTLPLAIAAYMLVLTYSLLMGGFIVAPSDMPSAIRGAFFTSYFWYGFQSLIINEFEGRSFGQEQVHALNYGGTNKWINLGILWCMWGFFQTIAFFIIVFWNKEKR
eukprot:TRINITY_DN11836_c0_g1_i1.p1 TRINITY_DN11836_c0_g1~~TRINITY_DN11836_c0_g1_i1.p1  ORF type:complete len:566 (+),score=85.82 TRINITY_DN11836_c0_g1_i1:213-1910(+)